MVFIFFKVRENDKERYWKKEIEGEKGRGSRDVKINEHWWVDQPHMPRGRYEYNQRGMHMWPFGARDYWLAAILVLACYLTPWPPHSCSMLWSPSGAVACSALGSPAWAHVSRALHPLALSVVCPPTAPASWSRPSKEDTAAYTSQCYGWVSTVVLDISVLNPPSTVWGPDICCVKYPCLWQRCAKSSP